MSSDPRGDVSRLCRRGLPDLVYRHIEGAGPTVVFLGGFVSEMTGTKATAIRNRCVEQSWASLSLDYSGHGASSGRFVDGSIGSWAEDTLAVIDAATSGPLLLVGSSMGGWIMTLVCKTLPERVAGMVGVASAPEFTEDLLWNSLSPQQQQTLREKGNLTLPGASGYPPVTIGWGLIEDGRRQRVLDGVTPCSGPVRLLHGLDDRDVPWQASVRLAQAIGSDDVTVTLVKGGDHQLSAPRHIRRLLRVVEEVRGRVA